MSILALAACGDDDDAVATPPAEPTPAPRLLTVEVTENAMQDENASTREMTTRTEAATTKATLNSFTMRTRITRMNSQSLTASGSAIPILGLAA